MITLQYHNITYPCAHVRARASRDACLTTTTTEEPCPRLDVCENRVNMLHTRNQHLRNHRGISVACSNECSVAFSNGISLFSGIFQRFVTCPVDFHWSCPMDFQ